MTATVQFQRPTAVHRVKPSLAKANVAVRQSVERKADPFGLQTGNVVKFLAATRKEAAKRGLTPLSHADLCAAFNAARCGQMVILATVDGDTPFNATGDLIRAALIANPARTAY